MLSTVDDMYHFYKALFDSNKLLKPETRALRFNPSEPTGLAGSDLVSSFLYERLPGRGIDITIASNSPEVRFMVVRNAIAGVLGIEALGAPGQGAAASVAPANAKAPPAAVATLLNAFVAAINSGDVATLTTFVADHFVIDPGTPAAAQRASRFAVLHQNLGALAVSLLNQMPDGTVEVSVTSANEGRATLKIGVDAGSPPRITSLQVMVGG
jgi:hypothetical protein